jgi:hypothetical protein
MEDDTPLTDDIDDVVVDGTDVRPDDVPDVPAMGGDTLDVSGNGAVESDVPRVSAPVLPNELVPRRSAVSRPQRLEPTGTLPVIAAYSSETYAIASADSCLSFSVVTRSLSAFESPAP